MRRTTLLVGVVAGVFCVVVTLASPANARPSVTASCAAANSGWTLVDYVAEPYEGWETTGLWTTWTDWVDEDAWYSRTELTPFETYAYALEVASLDSNGDRLVCMKLATPVPTEQPQLVSPWLFDWDVFLIDNVMGPKMG